MGISYMKTQEISYEKRKERKHSYNFLKVWGCLAKIAIPKPKMVKIGKKKKC